MLEVKFTEVDEATREKQIIFEDVSRFANRSKPVRNPYLETFRAIKQKYKVKTALDIGCGMGLDISYMLKIDIDAYGIDGSDKVKRPAIHPDRFIVGDIRDNIWVTKGVDYIHCREVAEHLPFRCSETLVRNIVRNCRVCYFTAATPGQRGSGHINCQHHEFWLALFKKYGFTLDVELTEFNKNNNRNNLDRKNGFIISGRRIKVWAWRKDMAWRKDPAAWKEQMREVRARKKKVA